MTSELSKLLLAAALTLSLQAAQAQNQLLFIGNSFTFGAGAAVRHYRADTVTDLNNEGIGGVADANPYDGIDAGKMNLWATDHYHASDRGYYLEALVIFGQITGLDPRSLGDNECSGFELGLSREEVRALQQVAFDELAAARAVRAAPLVLPRDSWPERCGVRARLR